MTKKKKIISDSIFLPIIINTVGIEQYGAFIQIIMNPGIITTICTLSIGGGFMRYTSTYEDNEISKLSKDFYTVVFFVFSFSLIGAALLYFTAPELIQSQGKKYGKKRKYYCLP